MEKTERFQEMIEKSRVIAFLGGAGVSTESGLPDFRSSGAAIYALSRYGYKPETLLSHEFFMEDPETFFTYYKNELLRPALPNPAHYALARLEERGKLNAVVTQNIDGLHHKAGSKKVYALHGSVDYNRCMDCGRLYDAGYIRESAGIPRCECGGIIRPEIVLYGESLEEYVWRGAMAAISSAEMLIIGGTSLAVQPAALLTEYFMGKHLVVINQGETPCDSRADLIFREAIGELFSRIS